jgi:hypothetical protein
MPPFDHGITSPNGRRLAAQVPQELNEVTKVSIPSRSSVATTSL